MTINYKMVNINSQLYIEFLSYPFFIASRSNIECSLSCIHDSHCSAISWDEKSYECLVLDLESLVCDADSFNSTNVFLDPTNLPKSCEGISHIH